MEVAPAASNLVPSKKKSSSGCKENAHGSRRSIRVPSSNMRYNMDNKSSADSEGDPNEIPTLTCSDVIIMVDDEKDECSERSQISPSQSLTPPPILEAMYDGQVPSGSGDPPKNEKRHPRRGPIIQSVVPNESKRNRITRNRDDPNDIVNNYVDVSNLKQPRQVNPPVGAFRKPFKLPKLDLEKEKDRLKIHMVGPKTRANPSEQGEEERRRTKRKLCEIGIGEQYQAIIPSSYSPTKKKARYNYMEDKDDVLWSDSVRLNGKEKELDEAWSVIRRQFDGRIGLDAVLHRLMKCNYDIGEMIRTIEVEQFQTLPQPFEKFNNAQQREFERLLRKPGNSSGKHREGEKIFRLFQEKFLKTYYMGEILDYYYSTKRKGCYHELYHRCACKEKIIDEPTVVSRIECVTCTRYIWGSTVRTPERYCTLCDYYLSKYRFKRKVDVGLTEPEELLARKWFDLEKSKGRSLTKKAVFDIIEKERQQLAVQKPNPDEFPSQYLKGRTVKLSREEICSWTQKFQPEADPKCSLAKQWGQPIPGLFMKQYTIPEQLKYVQSFHKFPDNFENVASDLDITLQEVKMFFSRYNVKYNLGNTADSRIPPDALQYTPDAIIEEEKSENADPNAKESNLRKRKSVDQAVSKQSPVSSKPQTKGNHAKVQPKVTPKSQSKSTSKPSSKNASKVLPKVPHKSHSKSSSKPVIKLPSKLPPGSKPSKLPFLPLISMCEQRSTPTTSLRPTSSSSHRPSSSSSPSISESTDSRKFKPAKLAPKST